jgi:hypothetical protein
MRRALTLMACVLVAGCGGGSTAPKQVATVRTATQPPEPAPEVGLSGDRVRRVEFGQPLQLEGAVRRQGGGGDPIRVRLLASPYPHVTSKSIASTTTGEGGHFEFTVRPRINTRFSAEVESTPKRVSGQVLVYAMPKQEFRVEPLGPGSGVFVLEITHPPGVFPTNRPVQFYVHLVGRGKRFTRVGEAHLDRVTPRRAVARLRVTRQRPADDAVACVPAMIAEGFGDPPIRDCGKRRVRVKRH